MDNHRFFRYMKLSSMTSWEGIRKMKRSGMAAVMAVVMLFSTLLWGGGQATATPKVFTDVSEDFWAKKEIDYLTERQIINGYPDGRFGVSDPITRAQAAVMMIRALGWGVSAQDDPGYPDVNPSHWAYNEIAMMKHTGIFAPEGYFEPDKHVTRAEMADMLVKTFDLHSVSGAKFSDIGREHWAYDAVNILATNRITTGYADGSFRPENEVNRTEFSVFVARALNEAFRPVDSSPRANAPTIYDVEIGDNYVQLIEPLLLTDTWMLPGELFEKLGYQIEETAADTVYITTDEGVVIRLQQGPGNVWVGDTLVEVKKAVERIDGQLYIEGSPILRALEKPLVYYPEQRLVRIESPRITVSDIKAKAPETIVDVIHQEQPYWHWVKRDHDYLEKMRLGAIDAEQRAELLQEMDHLTVAFSQYEQEKVVVRGLNYYSDHVTGKIDAVTRGLEARYLLLYKPEQYAYPGAGKSGSAGVFSRSDNLTFDYLVADHMFEWYEEYKQALIHEIETNTSLHFEAFQGLNVHGIPFNIKEHYSDGTFNVFSGRARSDRHMLVVNSSLNTFIHEFGHNWDYVYGDHDQYLAIRDREGYTPVSDEWEHRIGENFAEDFVEAFLPADRPRVFKALFGQPTQEQSAAFREWVEQREQALGLPETYFITVNGASLLPEVMKLPDGKLHVQGVSSYTVNGWVVDESTGETTDFEIVPNGTALDYTVQLPSPGVYRVVVGGEYQTTVVYMPNR